MIIDTGVETDTMMSDGDVIVVMMIATEKGDVARLLLWRIVLGRDGVYYP